MKEEALETVQPRELAAATEVEQSRAVAEIQASIAIAKRFPRDAVQALDRIQNSCTRPGLAAKALYQYARGGTDITGPSIRLAEAVAQAWGNIDFGVRELDQRDGVSTVEAYAWDKENNVRQTKSFQVAHKRHTKKGSYKLEDPRDIYEMIANQGARRLRACILGVIPGDVTEAAVEQCERTLTSQVSITEETIKSLIAKFGALGVTREQLEARIQRRLDSITPQQMVQLGKVYNSISDGMSVPADWFDQEPAKSQTDSLKEKLSPKSKAPPDPDVPALEEPTPAPPPSPIPPDLEDSLVSCPDGVDEYRYASFCNGGCPNRTGCPTWPADEGGEHE